MKIQANTVSVNWTVTEKLRSNFTFGGHTKSLAGFQPPAEGGLEASFASGDEKMQMVRLKRGFIGACKGWNERR